MAANVIKPVYRPYNGGGVLTHYNNILWAGYKDVWMSADLGKSWSLRTPFNGFNNNCIKDIHFISDQIGLATTQNGEIYTTNDQGLSWIQHVPPNPFRESIESARFVGSPMNIIACSYSGDWYRSYDGGNTFLMNHVDSFATQVLAGTGGTAYIIGGTTSGAKLWQTNDFGLSWNEYLGRFDFDSYSADRDQCDTSYFYVSNDDRSNLPGNFSRGIVSSDAGASWQVHDIHPVPYRCGSVSTAPNAVFMQTFSGIIRSTDQGETWKDIGGPPNITATRFVTALDNNTIAAVDSFGSVWVTDNGGGDSVSVLDVAPLSIVTADQKTDTIGGSVAVPISINGLTTTEDFTVVMHYDNGLIYNGTFASANTRLDIPGESWAGRSKIRISGADSKRVLSQSYFDVFSDNTILLKATFDSVTVESSIVPCHNLLPASFFATSTITSASGCGADILTNFIRDSTMPELRIVSNPAERETFISSTQDLGEVNISVFDMLGSKRSEGVMQLAKNTNAKLSLPFSNGVYSVRVKSSSRIFDLRVVLQR